MAKLITQDLIFLPESESLIDVNVGLNRKFKELLESVEKELALIEFGNVGITATLKGQLYQTGFPFHAVECDINPNSLPADIQSKIRGVLSRVVSEHLPKTEPPPS